MTSLEIVQFGSDFVNSHPFPGKQGPALIAQVQTSLQFLAAKVPKSDFLIPVYCFGKTLKNIHLPADTESHIQTANE